MGNGSTSTFVTHYGLVRRSVRRSVRMALVGALLATTLALAGVSFDNGSLVTAPSAALASEPGGSTGGG